MLDKIHVFNNGLDRSSMYTPRDPVNLSGFWDKKVKFSSPDFSAEIPEWALWAVGIASVAAIVVGVALAKL